MEREKFGSKIGAILAAAGSAVGLGNVWRFPIETGQNGGAAFIIIYVLCILVLGLPIMISEFLVGRHTRSNTAGAYRILSEGSPWKWVGRLGVFTGWFILCYYGVVGAWTMHYTILSAINAFYEAPATEYEHIFEAFVSNPWMPTLWLFLFIGIIHYVITRGVKSGIEKSAKVMMPTLFVITVVLTVCSISLPGASKGVEFLLKPDWSKVNSTVVLEAMGQAFFSLSLGTACLCTFGSYFKRDTNLLASATQIALLDSGIAILAGLMIFPAAFSVGVQPDSGPSLIFITLPNVFQQAFGGMPVAGYVISIMFYALLVFAALTSTVSMHEIGTAFFHEELKISRQRAAWILTSACALLAIFCSFSVGAYSGLQLFGMSLMDFCDFLTAQLMLPTGAFLTSIMLGWFVSEKRVRDEFTNRGTVDVSLFHVWRFTIRFIVPLCIILIFLHQFSIL